MRKRPGRARLLLLGLPLGALVVVAIAACGDDESAARKGGAGDSCQRTDDCEAPLACIASVCGGTDAGADATADAPADGPDVGQGDGASADAGPWSACDECLDETCTAAAAQCDAECVAVEGCIQMLCANLSAIGSPDEGECQLGCQNAHPGGKQTHLTLATCAIEAACSPPCTFFPQEYDQCRAFMNAGDCYDERAGCDLSADCVNYRDCLAQCGTLADCLGCDDDAAAFAGRQLLEAYEVCVAGECLLEAWLP